MDSYTGRHWPAFHARPDPAVKLSDIELRYLEASCERDLAFARSTGRDHLVHLKSLGVGRSWGHEIITAVEPADGNDEPYYRAINLCFHVVRILRIHGPISVRRIAQQLQKKGVLRALEDSSDALVAENVVFAAIGWISLLYVPARYSSPTSFRVEVQSTGSAIKSNIDSDKAARPLDELLRAFGDLLPKQSTVDRNHFERYAAKRATKFKVSCLNISAMRALANMQIRWVDSISAHLEFDPTVPAVSIFKCPSFCRMQQSKDSILSDILQTYYEDDEKPCQNFNVPNLMAEMMLSYSLMFKDDRRARQLYRSHERRRATMRGGAKPIVDRCLDELCGHAMSSSFFAFKGPVRDTYDVEADFPILKDRLQRIQDYMEGIEPNRFLSLWRDRRDLKVWYTIWAVLLLGLVGVILAIASLALTAVQVNVALRSYDLQLKAQNPPRRGSEAL